MRALLEIDVLDPSTSGAGERLRGPDLPPFCAPGKPGGMEGMGRFLIVFGILAIVIGLVLLVVPRVPWLGRLPGDLVVRREHFTFYFPIVTSIVVSVVLTILLNIFFRR